MNTALSWGLLVAAFVAGYVGYGWSGVALAATVTVFWMLLQASRAIRVLKDAGASPIGQVPNAVMLHSRLRTGMRLPEVLKLTRSLGRRLDDAQAAGPESYSWADAAGDEVRVELREGRVTQWELKRAAVAAGAEDAAGT